MRAARAGIIVALCMAYSRSAAAEPAEPAEAQKPLSPDVKPPHRWAASAGVVTRPLADGVPTYGGELALGGGIARRWYGFDWAARYAYAQTPNGLSFHSGHVSAAALLILGPLRLGVGFQLGGDAFSRSTGGLVGRLTMGVGAIATADLFTVGTSTFFLGVRGEVDVPNPVQFIADGGNRPGVIYSIPGASGFVGVRF
jgi:hypothetical protein